MTGETRSGEKLLVILIEKELTKGNTFFNENNINKYTWMRAEGGRATERALMD